MTEVPQNRTLPAVICLPAQWPYDHSDAAASQVQSGDSAAPADPPLQTLPTGIEHSSAAADCPSSTEPPAEQDVPALSATHALLVCESSGLCMEGDPWLDAIMGRSCDLTGQFWQQLLPAANRIAISREWDRLVAAEKSFSIRTELDSAHGTIPVTLHARCVLRASDGAESRWTVLVMPNGSPPAERSIEVSGEEIRANERIATLETALAANARIHRHEIEMRETRVNDLRSQFETALRGLREELRRTGCALEEERRAHEQLRAAPGIEPATHEEVLSRLSRAESDLREREARHQAALDAANAAHQEATRELRSELGSLVKTLRDELESTRSILEVEREAVSSAEDDGNTRVREMEEVVRIVRGELSAALNAYANLSRRHSELLAQISHAAPVSSSNESAQPPVVEERLDVSQSALSLEVAAEPESAIDHDDELPPAPAHPEAIMEQVSPSVEPAFHSEPLEPAIEGPLSILVVDDSDIGRRMLLRLVEKLACRGSGASGASEALALLPSLDPDVVLIDCQMPGIDGYELTKRIRALDRAENRRHVIIGISADLESDTPERCARSGMDFHLSKPIQLERLAELIVQAHPHARFHLQQALSCTREPSAEPPDMQRA